MSAIVHGASYRVDTEIGTWTFHYRNRKPEFYRLFHAAFLSLMEYLSSGLDEEVPGA
jgi:hypothetical protein